MLQRAGLTNAVRTVLCELRLIDVFNVVATCAPVCVCGGGPNGEIITCVEIGKGIGGHLAVEARQATIIVAGTKGSSMDRVREKGGTRKKRKVNRRRADEKSMGRA